MKLAPDTILTVALQWSPDDVMPVGRIAMDRGAAVLEYAEPFLASRLMLEPRGVYRPQRNALRAASPRDTRGLHGMFADSLPDSWGERLLRKECEKSDPPVIFETLSAFDYLAWIGRRGPGALVYSPTMPTAAAMDVDVDHLAQEAEKIYEGKDSDVADAVVRVGGSAGGARPKALIGIRADGHAVGGADELPPGYTAWIVKFGARDIDAPDAGVLEMVYADMAKAAGLDMAECRLIPSKHGPGHFATKRFDRTENGGRLHMLSMAGALEVPADLPSIDYDTMLRVVRQATRSEAEVLKGFRRMVFNVVACNRDDHLRQHALLMDRSGKWTLSPSYDLTFDRGTGGEHMLAVAGEGKAPTTTHIVRVAQTQSIRPELAREVLQQTREAVSRFPALARARGVSAKTIANVWGVLDGQLRTLTDIGLPRRAAKSGRLKEAAARA